MVTGRHTELLKKFRADRHLSVPQAAALAVERGVERLSSDLIYRLENGGRPLTDGNLDRIARAYQLSDQDRESLERARPAAPTRAAAPSGPAELEALQRKVKRLEHRHERQMAKLHGQVDTLIRLVALLQNRGGREPDDDHRPDIRRLGDARAGRTR